MAAPDDIPFWRKVLGILLLPVFALIILVLALIAEAEAIAARDEAGGARLDSFTERV